MRLKLTQSDKKIKLSQRERETPKKAISTNKTEREYLPEQRRYFVVDSLRRNN